MNEKKKTEKRDHRSSKAESERGKRVRDNSRVRKRERDREAQRRRDERQTEEVTSNNNKSINI